MITRKYSTLLLSPQEVVDDWLQVGDPMGHRWVSLSLICLAEFPRVRAKSPGYFVMSISSTREKNVFIYENEGYHEFCLPSTLITSSTGVIGGRDASLAGFHQTHVAQSASQEASFLRHQEVRGKHFEQPHDPCCAS